MKKILTLIIALCLLAGVLPSPAFAAEELDLLSGGAALIDARTGQLLYDKGARDRMYPASMTKVMTALLVAEICEPYEVVTASATALDIDEPDSSGIDLQIGEQFTVEAGLYALMLPSANDAANALAEHTCGSIEAFVDLMNERAREIGALDTHFANPHGLHEDDHYTTAYDMALITAHAMNNERFRDYFGAQSYEMPPTNLTASPRNFNNPQLMLSRDSSYYHPAVLGGKTGFTLEAMYTLTSYASRDGRDLVAVVMHGDVRADTFDDTRTLLDFGFSRFRPVTISTGRFSDFQVAVQEEQMAVGSVTFTTRDDFSALLYDGYDPDQIRIAYEMPETFGRDSDFFCTARFQIPAVGGGLPQELGAVELEADVFLPYIRVAAEGFSLSALIARIRSDLLLIVLCVAVLAVLLTLIAVTVRQHRLKKMRRIRQQRLRQQQFRRPPAQAASRQYGQRGVYTHVQSSSRAPRRDERSRAR